MSDLDASISAYSVGNSKSSISIMHHWRGAGLKLLFGSLNKCDLPVRRMFSFWRPSINSPRMMNLDGSCSSDVSNELKSNNEETTCSYTSKSRGSLTGRLASLPFSKRNLLLLTSRDGDLRTVMVSETIDMQLACNGCEKWSNIYPYPYSLLRR